MLDVMSDTSALTQLPAQTISDMAYRALRAALMHREFQANEQIDLVDLSQRLGVSSTPLKEALRRLENEGLVEIRPRLGTFVRPITEARLLEITDARLALEQWGITRFDAKASPAALTVLDGLLVQSERLAEDLDHDAIELEDQFATLDHEFHLAILRVADNAEIERFFELLGAHVLLARAWCLQSATELATRVRDGVAEHAAILDALKKGDNAGAQALLVDHVQRSTDGACDIVRRHGGVI